jgi:hypothetical protein
LLKADGLKRRKIFFKFEDVFNFCPTPAVNRLVVAEIKDALAYLRLIENSADGVAFERVVNFPTIIF